jgi:hypothetical protein
MHDESHQDIDGSSQWIELLFSPLKKVNATSAVMATFELYR